MGFDLASKPDKLDRSLDSDKSFGLTFATEGSWILIAGWLLPVFFKLRCPFSPSLDRLLLNVNTEPRPACSIIS